MNTSPAWAPVDPATQHTLTLVADLDHPSVDHEWVTYLDALTQAAGEGALVYPNTLRPLVRGKVAPKRIGAFVNTAKAKGILTHAVGLNGNVMWEINDDTEGRNSGRPAAVYVLHRGAHAQARATAGAPAASKPNPAAVTAEPAAAVPVWDRDAVAGGLF